MSKCIILVGNIGSGKSTWVKEQGKGALIINDDSIVLAVHGGADKSYSTGLKPLYKTIENIIFGFAATNNLDIVVDRPNLSIRTRRRYVGLAHSFDMNVQAIIFPFENPRLHAERRMKDDGRGYTVEYWERVAANKNQNYEPPDKSEGFQEIVYER
jgi:predicted kinase